MSESDDAYHELYAYTMGRPLFILQHVVDANMAQRIDAASNSIGAVFALVGLYLHVERGFTGAQVQNAHRVLGRRKREWPPISPPVRRGALTVADVMAAPAGPERDAAIDKWCASVWAEFEGNRDLIVRLLQEYHII
jgi:uncharacterized protein DUF5946